MFRTFPGCCAGSAQLSSAGERIAEWLLKVGVERGANHYRRNSDPTLPADLPAISDEEI